MLVLSDGIREQVLDRASHDDLRKLARAEGMSTLLEEAVTLVRDGVTNLAEIMRSVYVMGV